MRKTFLSLCTAVFALLALSSCGKIWDEFGSMQHELDKMNERITALEEKLNKEVTTLNSTISEIRNSVNALSKNITELESVCEQLQIKDEEIKAAFKAADELIKEGYKASDENIEKTLLNTINELNALVAAKIAALELVDDELLKMANNYMTALQGIIADLESKIAIVNVETDADGNIILTLKDGSKLTVSNHAGLVTIVEDEDGNYYWAVIAEDGTVQSLDVPVGLEVEFIVSEDYELVVVFNGQELYTGAYVTDNYYSVITSVEEFETYAIITIGDVEYVLPKYMGETTFVIKAGVTYFEAGEQKEFNIAVEGVEDFFVMTKPDGWKANVVEGKLLVTAPVEENVYAEEEGDVILHGCDLNGLCKIAKLTVSVNVDEDFIVKHVAGVEFTDEETGETYVDDAIYIYNNKVVEITSWIGTSYSFENFYFGFANIDDFSADPTAYIDNQVNNYGMDISFIWYNMQFSNQYVPEVEIDPWTGEEYPNENPYLVDEDYVSLREIYREATYGDEMPDGSQFVIWWAPMNAEGQVIPEKAQYFYYEPVYAFAEKVEAKYNDVLINYSALGDAKFYAGKFVNDPEDYYNYVDLEQNLFYYQEYGVEMGVEVEKSNGKEVWLSDFALGEGYEQSKLLPNTEYAVYFFPEVAGKDKYSYTYEADIKPYIYTFKTKRLGEGGSAKVTTALNEEQTSISQIAVDITPNEDAETVWYNFYSDEELDSFEDNDALIADLCKGYVYSPETPTARLSNLNPETSMNLVVLAVNDNGRYSEIYVQEYESDAIPYSEAITIAVESVTFDAENPKKVSVVYNVTGADELVVRTGLQYNTTAGLTMVKNLMNNGGDYYQFDVVEVVDGKATVEYTNYATTGYYKYIYSYAIACNLDTNKDVESLAEVLITDISAYEVAAE